MGPVRSYRDLDVWRSGMDLTVECYRLVKLMPKSEEFRIISQLLRAAASVPANIAEGRMRGTRKDYARSISIARGSLAETETFLLLSLRIGLLAGDEAEPALAIADKLGRQLNVLWNQLAGTRTDAQIPTAQPKT